MALANMTASACSLGTTSAATHQIFQTLFLLSAVALGNPFSWAAQAFLPPLLAQEARQAQEPGEMPSRKSSRSRLSVLALAKLVTAATCTAVVASICVVVFCRRLGWVTTGDPAVLRSLAFNGGALVPFVALYPLLLTLEGALYGAQRRRPVVLLSIVFWCVSSASLNLLKRFDMLSLSTIWLSSGFACGVSCVLTAVVAFN
ncbi:unnamed protein product, partial [Polarella glacialis]